MWPVPQLLESQPPCLGVSFVILTSALVTTGTQKKSVRMRPVITTRLRAVDGLMSPYLMGRNVCGMETARKVGVR